MGIQRKEFNKLVCLETEATEGFLVSLQLFMFLLKFERQENI